ncbi:MAG: UvrB/UvrC motif-containing protein [Kiritimatiellia bacterium]
MLCENCHGKEATVHLTQIVDGKVTKFHLCEACAEQKGLDVHGQPIDLGGVLENLKEQLSHLQEDVESTRPEGPATCPACGMTRAEIVKKGRLGCDRCYEAFAAEMLPVVVSIQHGDQHLGKVPRRASARMKASVEMARLRRELDQAVAGENYEKAAQLRDQIKALPPGGDEA